MKNSTKKRLLSMLLTLIVILPWTQPNTDSVSVIDDVTYEEGITCYSEPETPDERPVIITPN